MYANPKLIELATNLMRDVGKRIAVDYFCGIITRELPSELKEGDENLRDKLLGFARQCRDIPNLRSDLAIIVDHHWEEAEYQADDIGIGGYMPKNIIRQQEQQPAAKVAVEKFNVQFIKNLYLTIQSFQFEKEESFVRKAYEDVLIAVVTGKPDKLSLCDNKEQSEKIIELLKKKDFKCEPIERRDGKVQIKINWN